MRTAPRGLSGHWIVEAMEDTDKQVTPIKDSAKERVNKVVRSIGAIASTVTACIRSLTMNNAYDAPRGGLDEMSYFELSRYLKAPSLKIPFYFAAERRMSSAQKEAPAIGSREIIDIFNAHELASLLALTYLYKRVRTRIKDSEDWERIHKSVEEHLEISSLLGQALPSIGFGNAILVGTIRPLALALFFLIDPEGYKQHRDELKTNGVPFDLAGERNRWGITHLDVACRLLIQLGFGQTFSSDFYNGLASESDANLNDEQLRFRLMGLWIEALTMGSIPPKVRGEEKHQASGDVLDLLFDSCGQVRASGVTDCWIGKGKKNVSKSSHPALFAASDLNNQESSDEKQLYAD